MARIIGVSPTAVCSWENGTREPNTETIKKLCKALDVNADVLFDTYSDVRVSSDAFSLALKYDSLSETAKKIICFIISMERENVEE